MGSIHKLCCALIVLASQPASAVNLVPNPSFETFTQCPNAAAQLGYVPPWSSPNLGTPDYYHIGSNGACSPPFGVAPARTGSAYVGIFAWYGAISPTPDYREYIEIPLVSPLVAGTSYDVSFYVRLGWWTGHATDRLGAYLSVGSVGPQQNVNEMLLSPQIENPIGNFLTDITAWTLVGGTYIASGGEDHLTIGNFYPMGWASVTAVGFPGGSIDSYYFIDDVAVKPTCCDADVNADGTVNLDDLGIVTSCVNTTPPPGHACEPADINCDGSIDVVDMQIVLCNMATPGNPACCSAPTITTPSPGVFCIDGDGDGSDWSWQIDANPLITVPGPTPSTAGHLRDAYVASINTAGIAGLLSTRGPASTCFTVSYPQAFQFFVGAPGGPVTCLVSGNPLGCPFNPMIYEEAYFPPSLPGLTPGWLTAVAAAFLGAALFAERRSRPKSAPVEQR